MITLSKFSLRLSSKVTGDIGFRSRSVADDMGCAAIGSTKAVPAKLGTPQCSRHQLRWQHVRQFVTGPYCVTKVHSQYELIARESAVGVCVRQGPDTRQCGLGQLRLHQVSER